MIKKKKRRRVIIGVVIISGILLLTRGIPEDGIAVNVGYPTRETISEYATASGKLIPSKQVNLTSEIPGEILEIYPQEGDFVKKGELVVKLKEEDYLAQVEKAQAAHNIALEQYSESLARFELLKNIHYRDSLLFTKESISREEYEKSQSEYLIAGHQLNSAKYNIESAKAAIEYAKKDLSKTSIFSPIDGTIIQITSNVGEKVAGTSQMSGTQIMNIADLSTIEVNAGINERDILNISTGDSASIEIDAIPGKKFTGRVLKIANSSNKSYNNLQPGEYSVKIGFDKLPQELKSGMGASVEIYTDKKNNVLTIPLEAIVTKECFFEGETQIKEYVFIYLPESSSVQMREIVSGIQNFRRIEIRDGEIDDSTMIVTGPYNIINNILEEGSKVIYE
ncbi:MAG: efflux RND transporter periplasmic adaptor subunit [Bacteroidales bacterium]|nr:efflux RND transporter periplasmic adaptor subunit [Bacteroidales bacterium]